MSACDHCGTSQYELQFSASASAEVCLDCHSKAAKAGASSEQASKEASPVVAAVPSPSSLVPSFSGGENEPEVERLFAKYKAGEIEPEPVELRPLPDGARPIVVQVAELYRLVFGLRLWAADDRPVVFACGWIAEKLKVSKATAWRARKALVDAGVLEHVGSLPARGKRGTDLFAPVAVEKNNVVPIRRAS